MDKLEREQKEEKSGESPTFEDLVRNRKVRQTK